MKTIWKYVLPEFGQPIQMPMGAKVLHLGAQNNDACLWAEVEPEQPAQERRFIPVGTGHPMPPVDLTYVGTTLLFENTLVLHWYEIDSPEPVR